MRRALLLLTVLGLLTAGEARAALPFKPCKKGFECADVKVPLDYDKPFGAQVRVAVGRLPARDQRRKLGAIFINYGGPCCGAIDTTRQVGRQVFAPFLDRFDLIAFDPRGTGDSRPLLRSCDVNQETQGVYRTPFTTPATFDAERELRKATYYARRCERRNARLAPHVGTGNVARDIDEIRSRLGLKEINYVGFSYGTQVGATYAALFGDRLRATVLDGATDPLAYITDPLGSVRGQTLGFERALDRYFAACRRNRSQCPWTRGGSPEKAYERIVRRADDSPLPLRRNGRTPRSRRVDGDLINFATVGLLYAKQAWPLISIGLEEARRGTAAIFREQADSGYGREDGGRDYAPTSDRFFMITAGELEYPEDPQIYFDNGARAFEEAPHFYSNWGYSDLNWARYRPLDDDRYSGPFALPPSVETPLVIGTTFDPATPYADAVNMTKQLGNARLLTMRGDGHTAFGGQSKCIDRAVRDYVLRLKLPPEGKKCRQQVPFRAQARASAATTAGPALERGAPPTPLTAPFVP